MFNNKTIKIEKHFQSSSHIIQKNCLIVFAAKRCNLPKISWAFKDIEERCLAKLVSYFGIPTSIFPLSLFSVIYIKIDECIYSIYLYRYLY